MRREKVTPGSVELEKSHVKHDGDLVFELMGSGKQVSVVVFLAFLRQCITTNEQTGLRHTSKETPFHSLTGQ